MHWDNAPGQGGQKTHVNVEKPLRKMKKISLAELADWKNGKILSRRH
jgi:hypothetical protein